MTDCRHRAGCPHMPVSERLGDRLQRPHAADGWRVADDGNRSEGNDRYTNPTGLR